MSDNKIIQSADLPVPPVRRELQLIPVQNNGQEVLYIHDTMGYVPSNFALNRQIEGLLSLINGQFSTKKIASLIRSDIDADGLLEFVQFLDKNRLLDSAYFKAYAEEKETAFEQNPIRTSALSGESYPGTRTDLNHYLSQLFDNVQDHTAIVPEKALYAPHIDTRVGANMYAKAFSSLSTLRPKRVVILATAHYTGFYPGYYQNLPFIGTSKEFEFPHGTISTDHDYFEELITRSDALGFTDKDRAHRIEHSIELHLLFARHIWQHNFKVVPVLIDSFDPLFYMPNGHLGKQINRFANHLQRLDDPDTFYLISGDLSHVGRKFGDRQPAAEMRNHVEEFDHTFIDLATQNQTDQLYSHIKRDYDPYRVCGFPPLYTFLTAFPGLKGKLIDYHWWDEEERESAVSFAAISY